jgi:hypothetical protein
MTLAIDLVYTMTTTVGYPVLEYSSHNRREPPKATNRSVSIKAMVVINRAIMVVVIPYYQPFIPSAWMQNLTAGFPTVAAFCHK